MSDPADLDQALSAVRDQALDAAGALARDNRPHVRTALSHLQLIVLLLTDALRLHKDVRRLLREPDDVA